MQCVLVSFKCCCVPVSFKCRIVNLDAQMKHSHENAKLLTMAEGCVGIGTSSKACVDALKLIASDSRLDTVWASESNAYLKKLLKKLQHFKCVDCDSRLHIQKALNLVWVISNLISTYQWI